MIYLFFISNSARLIPAQVVAKGTEVLDSSRPRSRVAPPHLAAAARRAAFKLRSPLLRRSLPSSPPPCLGRPVPGLHSLDPAPPRGGAPACWPRHRGLPASQPAWRRRAATASIRRPGAAVPLLAGRVAAASLLASRPGVAAPRGLLAGRSPRPTGTTLNSKLPQFHLYILHYM